MAALLIQRVCMYKRHFVFCLLVATVLCNEFLFRTVSAPCTQMSVVEDGAGTRYATETLENEAAAAAVDHFDAFYQDSHLRSYEHWIRGIGGTKLRNDEPNSTCIYRRTRFQLDFDQAFDAKPVHDARVARSRFSTLWGRSVLVRCANDTPIEYFESQSVENGDWEALRHVKWKVLRESVLHLRPKTQSVWLSCGAAKDLHLSLVPLDVLNRRLAAAKRRRIRQLFGARRPPNVFIFVLDSTSRANFYRAATSSVQYLGDLMRATQDSPSFVFQHFRMSTVGWGTAHNLGALKHGKLAVTGSSDKRKFAATCRGLSQFYDALGYYVPGYAENAQRRDALANCDFILSSNVFPIKNAGGKLDDRHAPGGKIDVDFAADFGIQLTSPRISRDIPTFAILHMMANHRKNANLMFHLDRYVRRLLEGVDKNNTVRQKCISNFVSRETSLDVLTAVCLSSLIRRESAIFSSTIVRYAVTLRQNDPQWLGLIVGKMTLSKDASRETKWRIHENLNTFTGAAHFGRPRHVPSDVGAGKVGVQKPGLDSAHPAALV